MNTKLERLGQFAKSAWDELDDEWKTFIKLFEDKEV